MKSVFKTIPAYPWYRISEEGQVVRISTGNTISWQDNGKGYKMVKLYSEKHPQGKHCLVHRLVMSTFFPIGGKMDVNHMDGDKANNSVRNLAWTTKSENTRHAHSSGLFSSRNKLTIEQVKEIRASSNTARELAAKYDVNSSVIYKIRSGYLYGYV